jgi:acetoin utilization protein AcuB
MKKNQATAALPVSKVMTTGPHCIGADQTLALAASRMTELHIGHLPVLEGGQLLGVVSERDIALIRSVVPDQIEHITVEEAMTAVPYCVSPETPVAEVARHMAMRKLGSAIVMEHGRIAGVFSATDALRVLAAVLDEGVPEPRTESRIESIRPPPR